MKRGLFEENLLRLVILGWDALKKWLFSSESEIESSVELSKITVCLREPDEKPPIKFNYEPKLTETEWWSSVFIIICICASIFIAFMFWVSSNQICFGFDHILKHFKRVKKDEWTTKSHRRRSVSNCYDRYECTAEILLTQLKPVLSSDQLPLNDINESTTGWGKTTGRHSIIGLSVSQVSSVFISSYWHKAVFSLSGSFFRRLNSSKEINEPPLLESENK